MLFTEHLNVQNVASSIETNCSKESVNNLLPPILHALVTVEAISLRPFNLDRQTEQLSVAENVDSHTISPMSSQGDCIECNDSTTEPKKQKSIQFSGIDCSSTLPPVDRVGGSESHQRDLIASMVVVKDLIDTLEKCKQNDPEILKYLDTLIYFFSTSLQGEHNKLKAACAKSINSHPNRIESARKQYLRDFERLRTRLLMPIHEENDTRNDLTYFGDSEVYVNLDLCLNVEIRLAHFVGQTIRYYLRMFLNPQPPRLSPKDIAYHQQTNSFSKVSELVEMKMSIGGHNEALEDACISALVSTALQRVYEFCGPDALLMSTSSIINGEKDIDVVITYLPDMLASFCTSTASQIDIPIRPPFISFDEDDIAEIHDDLQDATRFLAAAKASRFLLDLFTAKGVQNEIQRLGGWSKVETYAKISRKYKLWQICDFDAHLVSLCNHEFFLKRLQELCKIFGKQAPICENALASMAKRFRVTTQSKNIVKFCPEIRIIHQEFEDSRDIFNAFPIVCKKSQKKKKA